MATPILAVTGTDTGVGKTHVSCGLLRLARRCGLRLAPLKLVETGCEPSERGFIAADGERLAHAAGLAGSESVVVERFALPAAPSTAARAVGRQLRFSDLVPAVHAAGAGSEAVLLEGAGGLLVPIGPDGSFADLFRQLEARLVIVARDALGTLNHTLLTVEAAERRGLSVAAIVLNATAQPCELDHLFEFNELIPHVPVVGPLPWQPDAEPESVADQLAAKGADLRGWLGLG